MIKYEFELVLVSGRIDMNKLPDTPIITGVIKDKMDWFFISLLGAIVVLITLLK